MIQLNLVLTKDGKYEVDISSEEIARIRDAREILETALSETKESSTRSSLEEALRLLRGR